MKKIVIGGQMDKQTIETLVRKIANGRAEIKVMSDIEAALAIKTGTADFYIGACSTGAGGALGIALGLLGVDKCVSISTPAKRMSRNEIEEAVKEGKVAFGFVNYDAEKLVPDLLACIL